VSEARRRKPPNKKGCKPVEDVCVMHDRPLECRHGCIEALPHKCKDMLDRINEEVSKLEFKP
jgi:hypothetical protein